MQISRISISWGTTKASECFWLSFICVTISIKKNISFSAVWPICLGWNKKQPKKHVQPCHFCYLVGGKDFNQFIDHFATYFAVVGEIKGQKSLFGGST